MLFQSVALRGLLTVAVLLVSTLLLAVAVASAVMGSNVPTRYRYAGAVENGRGIPTHYVATGDGIRFSFFDALSQGRRAESYRVCVGLPGKAPVRCWSRTARYGVGVVAFSFELPADVPLGALTARWLVAGRVVASWPFLYVRGG